MFANKPESHILNVHFNAPAKGDVVITVTDTKGKEVGKKEVKNFSGDFKSQVNLAKNTSGTLFVTVVQNEDGVTNRIVLSGVEF